MANNDVGVINYFKKLNNYITDIAYKSRTKYNFKNYLETYKFVKNILIFI